MSVCTRGDGTVFVQYVANGKRQRKYFGRGPEALGKAQDFNLTRERPSESKVGPTFADIAVAYLTARQITASSSTYRALWYKFEANILPVLGNHYAAALTPEIVDRYVANRRKSVRMATVRQDVTYIIAALRFAVSRKLIAVNPISGYAKPSSDGRPIMPISTEQLAKLIEVAPEHLRRSILLSYYLGLRPGAVELFALRWSAIDWSAKTVTVESAKKGGIARREVPISQGLPLQEWYEADGRPEDSTIITFRGKSVEGVRSSWCSAKKRAGITGKVPLYAIRHSFVTALLHRGIDAQTIAGISGHSVSTLLNHYAHFSNRSKQVAIESLPSLHPLGSTNQNGEAKNGER
jgi:integrase